jgi:peroxiredoxin Q/BCP
MIFQLFLLALSFMVELKEGDIAPHFSAVATDGTLVTLEQFKGKNVILYFYPEDMTGGCTIQACNFRDDKAKFEELNTVILGVSLDDIDKHKQFTEKDKLNFPLLVDEGGKICAAYGVPLEDNRWPERWTFLIDGNGRIAKKYTKVAVRVHSAELQEVIKGM